MHCLPQPTWPWSLKSPRHRWVATSASNYPIYASHGIEEYWIADIDRETLVVHRQPRGKTYVEVSQYSGDASIAPLAAPQEVVAVRDIFN